jgi:cytoskeletal protein CcmA (bactofilin family)
VLFEGEDNGIEVEGDLYAHGDLEVCGYTTLHADFIVEKMESSGDHDDLEFSDHDSPWSHHNEEPEVIIRGELTVEEDVLFEEDLDVEGDVSFSEGVTVGGTCDGCV